MRTHLNDAAARAELLAAARRLELACRQAKLLAEAALAPCGGLFEELGLSVKLGRRAARPRENPGEAGAEEGTASPPADAPPAPPPAPEPGKPGRRKGAAA